jgi:hypothetical protein
VEMEVEMEEEMEVEMEVEMEEQMEEEMEDTVQFYFNNMSNLLKSLHDSNAKDLNFALSKKDIKRIISKKENIEHLIIRLKKCLNRLINYKNMHLPITNEVICYYYIIPKNDPYFKSLAENERDCKLSLNGHKGIKIEFIFYSHESEEFQREMAKLSDEDIRNCNFILLGHGDEFTVGSFGRLGMGRDNLAQTLNKRVGDCKIALRRRPNLLATECYGHLHKQNYENISVTALANEKYEETMGCDNPICHISLRVHSLEQHVQDHSL